MTAAGIAVAVPAVLAYNIFGKFVAASEAELEGFAHDLREMIAAGLIEGVLKLGRSSSGATTRPGSPPSSSCTETASRRRAATSPVFSITSGPRAQERRPSAGPSTLTGPRAAAVQP